MRATSIFVLPLVALIAGCDGRGQAPDASIVIDPAPVRDWCAPGQRPEPAGLWYSCTGVTRGDGERLAAQRALIDHLRAGGR